MTDRPSVRRFTSGPWKGLVVALQHRHFDVVTGADTRQIETDTKEMQGITEGPIFDFARNVMLFSNGEPHRRRRAPIAKSFAFKLMDAMRPRIAALATGLVTKHLDQGPIDFISEIAGQIPHRIIAEILGIPDSDLPVFMRWIADTSKAIDFIPDERRAEIEASLAAFDDYVARLLEERRAAPRDDFLSDYVAATAREGLMCEAEIRAQIVGLIMAGSDTTCGSLCMTFAHLLRNRDQWQAFCADPQGLMRGAVSEGLRYEPIMSGIPRVAVKDFEIDGCPVQKDSVVVVSLLSALRDPAIYAEPDRFDIARDDHPKCHPVFGGGAHRCVGEALARAEMEETLAVIARLAPNSELVGRFPRLRPGAIRQIDAMQVALKR